MFEEIIFHKLHCQFRFWSKLLRVFVNTVHNEVSPTHIINILSITWLEITIGYIK